MDNKFPMQVTVGAPKLTRRGFLAGLTTTAAFLRSGRLAADDPPAEFVENSCCFVRLPCGRKLAYAEYGDPKGRQTILLFHGVPSCRLEGTVHLPALKNKSGIRLLSVDRPGFGQSDPAADIRFEAWPNDVAAFADALGVEQFSLIACSGGAPYALAVARAFPGRVKAVALGCPMAPLETADTTGSRGAMGADFAQRHPVLARAGLSRFLAGLQRHPRRIPFSRFMGAAERAYLADSEVHSMYVQITLESFHQGPAEVCRGGAILAQPWAWWLGEVKQRVTIFQGCNDEIVTPPMARYLAAALPKAELQLYEGEGHMSLAWHHSEKMLKAALGDK